MVAPRFEEGGFIVTRLLLTALLAAALAFAQGGPGMGNLDSRDIGPPNGPRADGGGLIRTQRQTPFDIFAHRLKLSQDQKTEAQTVLADALKETEPMRQQLIQGRAAIADAILKGASADDLKKLMDTYTSVAAQVTGVETKTFSKVYAILKPNQQSKAASAFELMARIFSSVGGQRWWSIGWSPTAGDRP